MRVDALIFGGGAAGLWLLDELVRSGREAVLVESCGLGDGQTVASQGIIHGGLKYTLQGLLTSSAASIRDMPPLWRECLSGTRLPNLSGTRLRSDGCYLWRTDGIGSRLGMFGARFGLKVSPQSLDAAERPAVLAACPGTVARLDEQVISPASFVGALAAPHRGRILLIEDPHAIAFGISGPGQVTLVQLANPGGGEPITLRPDRVVFTAGAGNAALRSRVGLSVEVMQRRPLHMVLARGPLPRLNGHCVDGTKTRVTITSDTDSAGRTVWQVGGQLAEDGVALDEAKLVTRAAAELRETLPGIDLSRVELATYRVDRAEGSTEGGKRPDTFRVLAEGNVITAWPTKLVLAPQLALEVAAAIPVGGALGSVCSAFEDWPRPQVARPPWESSRRWHAADERSQRAA